MARSLDQPRSEFTPGEPSSGYYNDLTTPLRACGSVIHASAQLDDLTRNRQSANLVDIVQFGLGAWQLALTKPEWMLLADGAAAWLCREMDEQGLVAHRFDMPHTFTLRAPWHSSMVQGQLASLLVRLGQPDAARRAGESLVDPKLGLIVSTPEGPVLQEYPTTPPAHVLNGWIFSLWGLHDLAHAPTLSPQQRQRFADAWADGWHSLRKRLSLYEYRDGWTRYDLYPHAVRNPASGFYQRLHAAQLRALHELTREPAFAEYAERWERAAVRPVARAKALVRKIAFRTVKPRRP